LVLCPAGSGLGNPDTQNGYCCGNAGYAIVDKADYFRPCLKPVGTRLMQTWFMAMSACNAAMHVYIAVMTIDIAPMQIHIAALQISIATPQALVGANPIRETRLKG
jgi:hypothetical protein